MDPKPRALITNPSRRLGLAVALVTALFSLIVPATQAQPASPPSAPKTRPSEVRTVETQRTARQARQAEDAGDWERALELWRQIMQSQPGALNAYDGIRQALVELGRFDEALAFLQDMFHQATAGQFGIDPLSVAADRVEVLLAAGRNAEATSETRRLLAEYRGNVRLYSDLARVLFQFHRDDEAVALLRQGRTDCGDPALFAGQIAAWCESRMDFAGATVEYLAELERDPGRFPQVLSAICRLPQQHGADTIAAKVLENRLKTASPELSGLFRKILAGLHFRAKRYTQALEQYELLSSQDDAGRELLELAAQLTEEGEHRLALRAYDAVLARRPPPTVAAAALLGKGRVATAQGMLDTARAVWNQATTENPSPAVVFEVNRRWGDLEMQFGNPAAAREKYLAALKAAGRASVSQDTVETLQVSLALTYAREGDPGRSERELAQFVKTARLKSPAVAWAQMELARLAFRRGDTEQARKWAQALAVSSPQSEAANEAVALLALLADFKDSPEILAALARAEAAQFNGAPDLAKAILDSTANSSSSRGAEEAQWRIYELEKGRGRYAEALAALQAVIALGDQALKRDLALLRAGQLAAASGKAELAFEYLEQVLLEYPESPQAPAARKLLRTLNHEF